MKLATWNVNSARSRERHIRRWLLREQPDFLLLQEIKCTDAQFPELHDLGYHTACVGQKAYNGVAILSRAECQVVRRALPGLPEDDAQARFLEVEADGVRIIDIYLPNGNSGGDAGYAYKLGWMDSLNAHAAELLAADTPLIIAGDFNVCPDDDDLAPGSLPPYDALLRPETRSRFRALKWLGMSDAVRELQPNGPAYTFWDYQAGAWQRDIGLRIDHVMLSPTLAERLASATPDRGERGQDQPSDHVPVVVELR